MQQLIAALLLFFSLCAPLSAQYLSFQQNIDGCLNRNELATCIWLKSNWTADQTPEQKRQIQAKIEAIQSGAAKRIAPPPGTSPSADLEKGFRTVVDGVGTAFSIIFYVVLAILAVVFFMRMHTKAKVEAERPKLAAIPAFEEGPMKVDIAFQPIPAPTIEHQVHGGESWWRMHFNIRFSNQDWALFEKSGFLDKEFFSHPGIKFPSIDTSFTGASASLHACPARLSGYSNGRGREGDLDKEFAHCSRPPRRYEGTKGRDCARAN